MAEISGLFLLRVFGSRFSVGRIDSRGNPPLEQSRIVRCDCVSILFGIFYDVLLGFLFNVIWNAVCRYPRQVLISRVTGNLAPSSSLYRLERLPGLDSLICNFAR